MGRLGSMGHSRIRVLPLLAGLFMATFAAMPAWAEDAMRDSSPANGCGRLQGVHLTPIYYTREPAPYPAEAGYRRQYGRTILRLVIDKYGFARQADVVVSSGYAILDQAAIDSIKDRWRWEPPPPECQENGVVIRETYIWAMRRPGSKDEPSEIYLDDPYYPAQARARKEGGTGEIEYTLLPGNKRADPHVTSSTGSPTLDAAMIAGILDWPVVASGTASTAVTAKLRLRFIPREDPVTPAVMMGPAIIPSPADLPGKRPSYSFALLYPAPSRANDCGRGARVTLAPSPVNFGPVYPLEAIATGKQGRTVLDLLVDKGGTVSEAAVAETSGSPLLDQAAVAGVKGLWHYEAPPPECAGQGVRLRQNIDWTQGASAYRVMAGDPDYPTEAVAAKLSGHGVVQIKFAQDGEVEFTKVLTSTESDILDAAMVKIVAASRFTPGTKARHTELTGQETFNFVGDPDALRAAAAAPVRRIGPILPPPSIANGCGRNGDVFLAPMDGSHALVGIPKVQVKPASAYKEAITFQAQGALKMQVLVDKDGKPASVTVVQSSAPPEMERSVTGVVQEYYRWAPPPPECTDGGVIVSVTYVYTWAPEQLQIYADDPEYPDAARAKGMGAAGVVEISYDRDEINSSKIMVSTNSPELDDAMIKVVSNRLLAEMRVRPRSGFVTQDFPIMFMPTFVASPKQQAARAQATP
jgi:TonB family protein